MKFFPRLCKGKIARRSPCGERGLKLFIFSCLRNILRRSPCGERGLKCKRICKR